MDSDTGSVIQTMENITNFIRALHELQFPTSAIFSVPDIESHGWEERRAHPAAQACMLMALSAAARHSAATQRCCMQSCRSQAA